MGPLKHIGDCLGAVIPSVTIEAIQSENGVVDFDSTEQRVFLHLWRTYDLLKAIEDECLSAHNLTAQQYNVLRILKAAAPGGMQTMQLGQRMISRGPDMTRMLDRLEERKLIKRTRSPENRRVVEAKLLTAGLRLLDAMASQIVAMHERQLGHLTAPQQQQLIRLLRSARQPHEDATCNWLG
jgi:DNA-binding MarR family transcriptional regulator